MLTMEYVDKLSPEWRAKYEAQAFDIIRGDVEHVNESDGEILKQIGTMSDTNLMWYVQEDE